MIEVKYTADINYYYTDAEVEERFDILRVNASSKVFQIFTNSPEKEVLDCGELVMPDYLPRKEFVQRHINLTNEGYECDHNESLIDEPLPRFLDSFYADSKSEYLTDVLEIDMKNKEYFLWERMDLEQEETEELNEISRAMFDMILKQIKGNGFKRV